MQKKEKISFVFTLIVVIAIIVLVFIIAEKRMTEEDRLYAGWQTYKSQGAGYEIKYPLGYKLSHERLTEFEKKLSPFLFQFYQESISIKKKGAYVFFDMLVYENTSNLHPRDWWNWIEAGDNELLGIDPEKADNIDFMEDITINGFSAVQFAYEEKNPLYYNIGATIFLANNGKIFSIMFIDHNYDLERDLTNKQDFELFLKSITVQ